MATQRRLRVQANHLVPATTSSATADVTIRGALLVDGTGESPGVVGDLAVKDGKIIHVGGRFEGSSIKDMDGSGRILAPGFIDIHTHYDPQLSWDGCARPCFEHGVTTIVTGNCSLSVAPVRNKNDSDKMVGMFQTIEDLKRETFDAAVPFEKWEHFGEWLEYIKPTISVNVAALVGHSAVRLYVMGPEECQKRAATKQEIDEMCVIVEGAMEAGAVGVSTSYVDIDENLVPVPSRFADIDEKMALAKAMARGGARAGGRGMWACVHAFNDKGGGKLRDMGEVDSLVELGNISKASGVAVSFQPVNMQPKRLEEVTGVLKDIWSEGGQIYGQASPADVYSYLRLGETNLSLMSAKGWGRAMKVHPREARIANFRDPEVQKLLVESLRKNAGITRYFGKWHLTSSTHPDNQKYMGKTLSAIAEEEGVELGQAIIDISLRDELNAEFTNVFRQPTKTRQTLAHMITATGASQAQSLFHLGASDAGAHVTQKCGTGETTEVLTNFVRDGIMSLESAVHEMTGKAASQWGLKQRGTLAVGNHADLVLFNLDEVGLVNSEWVHDVPGGQSRYVRHAKGFDAVFVNGHMVLERDEYTGVEGCGAIV